MRQVALIGFGEAGSILGEDLARRGLDVATYDILLDSPATRAALVARARAAHVRPAASLLQALHGAQLVISAVTASSSTEVARDAAQVLHAGQWYLDLNSVSPATKRGNAQAVATSGAAFVEAAVMAAVPPQRLAVPILLGGPTAHQLEPLLRAVGMNVTTIAADIGTASAIKMCRSILIKGLEALSVECLLAARTFNAEDEVLASLDRSFPHMGWSAKLPDYLWSRVAEHGRRRAAEMREVALTLRDIGIEPVMATAIAERQQWLIDQLADKGLTLEQGDLFAWRALADQLKPQRDGNGER